ncbi:hypothetical protein BST13_27335 [Mycobacterium aquaticum]|uniref:Restriction endonuclease type IV Mrr domain-containing protein n=1 Tax=Mycobacterium aquaticum TaxID=1927124 RepID=A0A1X0AH01_9MYCO|nr:hypothetical protein BST13_27335 [Mycobacterium aquaticum]
MHEFDRDDPLLGPPDAIAEPLVDPQLEYLPIDQLSWENFERLLLRVAQDVGGLHNVRRFGTPGQAQKGLDVIGINGDGKAEGIQSKRRKTFTKTHLDDAVRKYTESEFPFPFARLAIGVSKQVAEREIVEHLIDLNVTLAPLEIEIWDQDALSRMLRPHPQIVTEFFGPATATRFCGEHTVIAVEIAGADAVATAAAVIRGPLAHVGGHEKLKRAEEIADSDPAGALALYQDVQALLTGAGFPAHAAEFDERVAHLLVATGAEADAVALVMERLWVAERTDDWLSVQVAARALKSLAGLPEFGPEGPDDGTSPLLVGAARVAGFIADNLHQPVPMELDLPTEELQHLSPGDRAQTVLFAAERALANDDLGWLESHAKVLSECVSETNSSHEDVALRIELVLAELTGDWKELLHRARTATRRDLGALTLARYARYTMWKGDYVEANRAYEEAINHACLAHRHEDAADWLYSQRLVMNRHVPVSEDKWHPLARSLSNLPSRPRLVTSATSSRENALAALHYDKKRSAAIHLRRYLCDSIRSGNLSDEIDARMLLGGLYVQTNDPLLAVRQMILSRDYEAVRSVAQDLGDSYLDVRDLIASPVSWVVATAFEFVAAEADLVPDALVDELIESALSAIDDVSSGKRPDSPVFSPQIVGSAYKMIGALSERLNSGHAVAVLDSLSGHVTAREHHYWRTDESHIRIAAGIAETRSDETASVALDHLMGLFARRAHPFGIKAKGALKQNLQAVGPRLQELADGGHHEAHALLASTDEVRIDPEDALAAANRLQKPTSNSFGRYAEGTRAINDSLLARSLAPEQRIACIEMLLQNARSPFEGSSNRQTYLIATANLSEDLDDEHRRRFLADLVDFVENPPPSQPDMFNASMTDPLGMMRWAGTLDSRSAAVLAAACFAREADEKDQVRDLAIGLISVVGEDDIYLAEALQAVKDDLSDLAPLLAQAGWAMRSVAAIGWARSPSMPAELGERLSRDPDARVRRSIATAIRDHPSPHSDHVREVLQADPRWSVRSILL